LLLSFVALSASQMSLTNFFTGPQIGTKSSEVPVEEYCYLRDCC
jgi:hypothetical protein